jgi:hypothetical protein
MAAKKAIATPSAESIAGQLTVPERVLLFCVASGTDWVKAGVTHATARTMLVKNLVTREHSSTLVLTEQGREVLSVLLVDSGMKVVPR